MKDDTDANATKMREAADLAARAGKDAVVAIVEAECEEDRHRIGAAITATTTLYAGLLATTAEGSDAMRTLAREMYMLLVVPELEKLSD